MRPLRWLLNLFRLPTPDDIERDAAMRDVTVRPANLGDCDKLAEIDRLCKGHRVPEDFTADLADMAYVVTVAEYHGEPVGFLLAALEPDRVYLEELRVAPDAAGLLVEAVLLRRVTRWLTGARLKIEAPVPCEATELRDALYAAEFKSVRYCRVSDTLFMRYDRPDVRKVKVRGQIDEPLGGGL